MLIRAVCYSNIKYPAMIALTMRRGQCSQLRLANVSQSRLTVRLLVFQASQRLFQPDDPQCRSQHRHYRRLLTNLATSLPPRPRQNQRPPQEIPVDDGPLFRRQGKAFVRSKA